MNRHDAAQRVSPQCSSKTPPRYHPCHCHYWNPVRNVGDAVPPLERGRVVRATDAVEHPTRSDGSEGMLQQLSQVVVLVVLRVVFAW